MTLQFLLLLWLAGVCLFAVLLYFTWAIWVSRYVQRYGLKAAFFLAPWAPLVDYARARRIARKVAATPLFLKCFAWFSWLALLFLVGGMVTAGLGLLIQRQ